VIEVAILLAVAALEEGHERKKNTAEP